MSEAIITVENLGKKYRLGVSRSNERYTALRDIITERAAAPFRALSRKVAGRKLKGENGQPTTSSTSDFSLSPSRPNSSTEEFWALRDVSFEVKQGEVLGIIGRNGAGKSTLLKILSRITEPTKGRIHIKGRVASLLEVGTGFHPELTGRENVFLNGAILGMTRAEIRAKFDEIVAFAEIDRFLDTPVKRYSSGMYVRLAFAVAAHLEPEILVVDEVLAVGDAEFQKKCLGKMNQVAHGDGRTVLFVSHNMAAVTSLCHTAVLLDHGTLVCHTSAEKVVARYLEKGRGLFGAGVATAMLETNEYLRLTDVAVLQGAAAVQAIVARESFVLQFAVTVIRSEPNARHFVVITSALGEVVFSSYDVDEDPSRLRGPFAGDLDICITVPGGLLKPGIYDVSFGADVKQQRVILLAEQVATFEVIDVIPDVFAERTGRAGQLCPVLQWQVAPRPVRP